MPAKTTRRAPAPLSNVEFVAKLMNVSEFGPMAQLVVLTALDKYTDKVISNREEVISAMEADGFISGHSWVGACAEIAAKLEARR